MARLSTPSARMNSDLPRHRASSSGSSTRPVLSSRSGTGRRQRRGTKGCGRTMLRSYWS
jgi:hypothetical protein